MKGPHFPSSEELERQLKAAKQLRGEFLMGLAVTAKRKFATQSRKVRRTRSVGHGRALCDRGLLAGDAGLSEGDRS